MKPYKPLYQVILEIERNKFEWHDSNESLLVDSNNDDGIHEFNLKGV